MESPELVVLMPIDKYNTRTFYKYLYDGVGMLETVTILKRGDDQQEGTVTAIRVFRCRHRNIAKSGEPLYGEVPVSETTTWHLPSEQLRFAGITHINAADRIVDKNNRYWAPLADNHIQMNTFENHVMVDCQRVDPPNNVNTTNV